MNAYSTRHKVFGGEIVKEPNGMKTIEYGTIKTELGEYSMHYVVDDERFAYDVLFKKKGK